MKIRQRIIMLGVLLLAVGQAGAQTYKNAKAPVEARVKDLLQRMTLEEKVGQLNTLLGWPMYEKNGNVVGISATFKEEITKRHIGSFWATLRADPWTQKTLETGLTPRDRKSVV